MPVGSKSFKLFPRGGFPEACEALGYGGVGWDVNHEGYAFFTIKIPN